MQKCFQKKIRYRCSALVVKFFEKYLWWSAIFGKFAYNALRPWTTAAGKLYFITTLINVLNNNFCRTLFLFRSSRSQVFFKIGLLKNFANFTGKHLWWSPFLIKLLKTGSNTGVILWYLRNFQEHCFYKTLFYSDYFCVFWKSGKTFSPEQLTNPMLAGVPNIQRKS